LINKCTASEEMIGSTNKQRKIWHPLKLFYKNYTAKETLLFQHSCRRGNKIDRSNFNGRLPSVTLKKTMYLQLLTNCYLEIASPLNPSTILGSWNEQKSSASYIYELF